MIIGVLFYQYRLSHDKKIVGFLWFKLSYTCILIWALVIFYLNINTGISLMFLFSPVILMLSIPLLISFNNYMAALRHTSLKRKELLLLICYASWTIVCVVVSVIFSKGVFPFIAIACVLIPFFIMTVVVMTGGPGSDNKIKQSREFRRDIIVLISSISMCALEFLFLRPSSIDKGFIFSLAITYIILNIIDWMEYLPQKTREITQLIPDGFFSHYHITPSEKRVAKALVKGLSNKEMAYNFGVAENTIKNQIYSIYRKTGTRCRVEFINRIKEAQMGQLIDISEF
ncbi:MAG: hypothetical protein JW881_06090 [Spirochaetales bacterium]|nr:hypothetical protein [Spirochaetales bacterium]